MLPMLVVLCHSVYSVSIFFNEVMDRYAYDSQYVTQRIATAISATNLPRLRFLPFICRQLCQQTPQHILHDWLSLGGSLCDFSCFGIPCLFRTLHGDAAPLLLRPALGDRGLFACELVSCVL